MEGLIFNFNFFLKKKFGWVFQPAFCDGAEVDFQLILDIVQILL